MKKETAPKASFRFWFVVGTAAILLVANLLVTITEYIFLKVGIIGIDEQWYWMIAFSATSAAIGLSLAALLGRIIFKPVDTVLEGMTKLSEGDFSVRVNLDKYEGMKQLANTFNSLAEELNNTEILRSNFVNEISHELKTPIVSLSGLISLMKNENLPPEKRAQYLAVMEEEAARLTQMTSSALYLSKIETQNILSGKSRFNVSEQIRNCTLLLERKWEKKELSPVLDFEEYTILANEDMLKQVWVNLIDNAIKFADKKSELYISARKIDGYLSVSVHNHGAPIPESEQALIFTKFYQCDKSRATEGNGIGLSIVKHIVDLHGGSISVNCQNGITSFTVNVPIQ